MTIRVACVQTDVAFGDPGANAAKAIERLRDLKTQGVDLAVFPEAYLTGYCFGSAKEAETHALLCETDEQAKVTTAAQPLQSIFDACREIGIHAVVGFAGKDGRGLYNGALMADDQGGAWLYAKTHIPCLGLDRYVRGGDRLQVWETRLGRIGVLICFDLRPPEPSRVLALEGADLIVLATNWPEGAEAGPKILAAARAAENKVYVATCDRVGTEKDFRFIGLSGIYAVNGQPLALAGDGEEVIMADLDLALARQKRNVFRPGEYETETFAARRPELYGIITRSKA